MATTNPCADVEVRYKGDGRQLLYTFPFVYISQTNIYVDLWNDATKEYVSLPYGEWGFANATTIQFNNPPPVPPTTPPGFPDIFNIRIYRRTELDRMEATFYPGSAIRAQDLNDDFDQLRLAIEESRCQLFGETAELNKISWKKYSISVLNGHGDTVTKPDQLEGRWPNNGQDKYIATTDAISARLDPYVQDTAPPTLGLPQKEQSGKQWFDTDDLVERFWDEDAGAWVTLANTGPIGPKGDKGDAGVAGFVPSVVGHAPITATTVGANIDLTFDPIPLTYLP